MVNIQQQEGAVKFVFEDNVLYLRDGSISYPLNQLAMVIDESDIITFKLPNGDMAVSFNVNDAGISKAEMESLYAEAFVGSTGGGGGVTPEEVQTAINDALVPVNEDIAEAKTEAQTAISALQTQMADKADITAVTALSNEIDEKEEVIARALTDLEDNKLDGTALDDYYTKGQVDAAVTTVNDALTAHTADSTVHVTASDKASWNAKLDSTALDDYYTKADIDNGSNAVAQALIELQENKLDASGYTPVDLSNYYTKAESDAAYLQAYDALTAHTSNTDIHVTASDKATWNAKQDALTAGTGIDITSNVISVTGGGGGSVTVDSSLSTASTNPVANSAITAAIDAKAGKSAAFGDYIFGATYGIGNVTFRNVNNNNVGNPIYYPKINGKGILTSNDSYARNNYLFSLVETSAVTTSMTAASTDAQVPSAKAVYDQLGGLTLVKLTQSEYDALSVKDSSTLYIINNVVNS